MDLELLTSLADLFGKGALLLLEYLKVLAWPLVVLTLALLYKRPLVSVLDRLRKASGFGAILELERDSQYLAIAAVQAEAVDEAASEAEGGGAAPPKENEVTGSIASEMPGLRSQSTGEVRRTERYPLVANVERVQRSWAELEALAKEMGAELKLAPWKRTPADVARELSALGFGSPNIVTIAQSLDSLRQRVLLAGEGELFLTTGTAESFEVAATSIMSNLERGMAEYRAYAERNWSETESE